MSYLVLARKYRPQNFEDVVGQGHVCQILQNSVSMGRIGHAYLFSGQRGTGKTTIARIFAKALNCGKGPVKNPCEKCVNCREITEGSSMDVLEIDAASNRGIDEIRAIRDNVKFAPASSKYKIYIIDEAHQITDTAFNALLKTLEEPPSHIVFMFATTEPQKIPLTILSRCQRFNLKPIPTEKIAGQLEKIIKMEKFSISKDAVTLIAQIANGSMRDSLSLLDQIVSVSPEKEIVPETVRKLLGLSPVELVSSFFGLIAERDARSVLNSIENIAQQGYDFVQFTRDLRDYIRKLIFVTLDSGDIIARNLLPEENEALARQKNKLSGQELVRILRILNRCVGEIRWSDNPRLIFELYSLRLIQPVADIDELIARVEELEKITREGGDSGPADTSSEQPPRRVSPYAAPAETRQRTEFPEKAVKASPAGAAPVYAAPGITQSGAPKDKAAAGYSIKDKWPAILEEIGKKKPSVAPLLENIPINTDSPGEIKIFLPEGFSLETVRKSAGVIEETIAAYTPKPLKLICEARSEAQSAAARPEPVDEVTSEQEEEKPTEAYELEVKEDENPKDAPVDHGLQKIVDSFAGKIIK
jgi:DNA polymerase III subunit gamma/tau